MSHELPDRPLRALVVEDEPHIRELIALHLGLDGWTVVPAERGEDALGIVQQHGFDLVVLDVMLPGLDGLTVLKALRRTGNEVPVLLLTARREETDKVLGLESGADDYLTKPFGVRELVARARALTRRSRGVAQTVAPDLDHRRPVCLKHVALDPARRRVTADGQPVELTAREFDLLYLLASNPGIVFSREALVSRIWREDTFVTERNVDTLIKRIRRKVEPDASEPSLILTVWGTGYKAADV